MRHPVRLIVALCACGLTVCGCNGTIRMRAWTPEALKIELAKPDGIRGVLAYYTKSVIEVNTLTQLVDKDGKPIGGCKPIDIQRVVTVTDYEHPYQVYYDYGLLETNTFAVQMTNNVLSAVNSQSTPDQGKTLANLGDAAASFAKIAA